MRVVVTNAYTRERRVFDGTLDAVKAALIEAYPWTARYGDDLDGLVNEIGRAQALFVELIPCDADISPEVTSKNTRR